VGTVISSRMSQTERAMTEMAERLGDKVENLKEYLGKIRT